MCVYVSVGVGFCGVENVLIGCRFLLDLAEVGLAFTLQES